MKPDPHWTTYLAALLAPTVAIIGSIIAYWQWRLAQNKLKLDLFNRRYSVYQAARTFLSSIVTSGGVKEEEIFKFMVSAGEAKWLLDRSIADYMEKQLYQKAIVLQNLAAELEVLDAGEARTRNINKQSELKQWFMAQLKILDEQFSSFLQLRH